MRLYLTPIEELILYFKKVIEKGGGPVKYWVIILLIRGVERHAVVCNALRRLFLDNDQNTRDIIMSEREI